MQMLQGEWKADGVDADGKATWAVNADPEYDASSDEPECTPRLVSLKTTGGSPLNLCCSLTSPRPKYFFQVEILEATSRSTSLSVGVVRPSEFKKGWGNRGCFYNGNLTNGSAALKVGYGPYLKQGDTATVEYTESEDKYQVKFHVNGTCLGIAFEIPKESPSSESFLPCLHGQGELTVRATVLSEISKIEKADPDEAHPLQGKWTLLQSYESPGGKTQIWPVGTEQGIGRAEHRTITLNLEPHTSSDLPNSWMMILTVFNTMRVVKTVSGDGRGKEYDLSVPPGTDHGVMSTMMMPPPPYVEIERKLSHAMGSDWRKLRLDDDGSLKALAFGMPATRFECCCLHLLQVRDQKRENWTFFHFKASLTRQV
jgi:hypothetical protein